VSQKANNLQLGRRKGVMSFKSKELEDPAVFTTNLGRRLGKLRTNW